MCVCIYMCIYMYLLTKNISIQGCLNSRDDKLKGEQTFSELTGI